MDLQEETFISDEELRTACNEAIDQCEQEVHTLYEDYFLTSDTISLVSGTERYTLPGRIYGHKIRRMVYENGSQVYKVRRIGDWKKFEKKAIEGVNNTSTLYEYFLVNDTEGIPEILLVPRSSETGAFITCWYLRQANRLEVDGDILDIPEAANFVLRFMKNRVLEKERDPELIAHGEQKLEQERQLLVSTLAAMVPDAENDIEPDFTMYEEMS
jgi:hypothetical protein